MRTTLDIEPDVLQMAKEIAAREKSTAGKVLSRLARQGYQGGGSETGKEKPSVRNGVPVLPKRNEPVTMEKVRRLMDEEGI